MNKNSSQKLIDLIKSPHWETRQEALNIIKREPSPEILAPVLDYFLKKRAIAACLFLIRSSSSFPESQRKFIYVYFYSRGDQNIRHEISRSLTKLSWKNLVEAVKQIITEALSDDTVLPKVLKQLKSKKEPSLIFPLMDLFKRTDQPSVRTEILKIFRIYRDIRTVNFILDYSEESGLDKEVLFSLVISLGVLGDDFKVPLSFFYKMLKSSYTDIRRASVWALARRFSSRIGRKLIKAYKKEKSIEVKAQILNALRADNRSAAAYFLMKEACYTFFPAISLPAESSLEFIEDNYKRKAALRIVKKGKNDAVATAIRFLGESAKPADQKILFELARNGKTYGIREAALTALKNITSDKVAEFASKLMEQEPEFTPACSILICTNTNTNSGPFIEKLLRSDDDQSTLKKQTALYFLPAYIKKYGVSKNITECLNSLLESENPGVRHLAAHTVSIDTASLCPARILRLAFNEKRPEIKSLLHTAVSQSCRSNWTDVLKTLKNQTELVKELIKVFIKTDRTREATNHFFEMIYKNYSSDFSKIIADTLIISSDYDLLNNLLSSPRIPGNDTNYSGALAEIICGIPEAALRNVIPENLRRVYNSSDRKSKELISERLSYFSGGFSEILGIFLNEANTEIAENCRKALLVKVGAK
ncbi:MAG: HEAT repeat domain-containing protein [Fibrobacterota bacterium]